MNATVTTAYRGNLALEDKRFVMPVRAAKAAIAELGERGYIGEGSYWNNTLVKPPRRAQRAKADTVTVYTAGFSTGELANVLAVCGIKVIDAGDR